MPFELAAFRYPIAFLGAFFIALYLTPIIRKGAIRYGVVDNPDGKLKRHKGPVAYLGGIAIYLAFLFSLALTYDFDKGVLGLLLAGSIIVMLGLFDDLKVLSPSLKLIGQLIAVLVLIKADIYIQLAFIPKWLAICLTIVWLVGMTNAINLIDVSDGLASGVSCVAGIFFYIIALVNGNDNIAMVTLCLIGATLGFLGYNRPPATIYLGDTGSMFLGFMLGALAMRGHYTFEHKLAAVAPVIILGVPIFDTFYIMTVRAIRGIPIMQGSPDHFAVRLRNNGVTVGYIAVGAYFVSSFLGCLALALCFVELPEALMLLIGITLMVFMAVFSLWRIGRSPTERPGQIW